MIILGDRSFSTLVFVLFAVRAAEREREREYERERRLKSETRADWPKIATILRLMRFRLGRVMKGKFAKCNHPRGVQD